MQFLVFENIYECLFIPNCTRKIIWLLVNNIQVTISVTLQHFTWQMKATSQLLQLYWIKIWHVNSSVKIHSLSPSHVRKLSSFFLQWKAVFTHSWIEELDHKAKEKLPAVLVRLSCQLFFEWLRNCVHETIQWTLIKIRLSNEAKIYKETEFLSSEGNLFNFSWLLPDLSFFTGCCTG